MKKISIVICLVLILTLTFTACSTQTPSSTTQGTTKASEPVSLKLAHGAPDTFPLGVGSLDFKESADSSNTGVSIELFSNAALGPESEIIQAVILGNCDIGISTPYTISNLINMPELLLFEMPWLIGDRDLYYKIVSENETFKAMLGERLEAKGLKYLGGGDIGSYAIDMKDGMVLTPDDLKGTKLRTAENPLIVDWFGALGTSPVVVNFSEITTALQQGVMDGVYTTTPLLYMTNVYQLATNVTQLNSAYCWAMMVMNLDKFNSLSKEQQDALLAAGKAYSEGTRLAEDEYLANELKEFEKAGVTYHALTEAEMVPFQQKLEQVYATWRGKIGAESFDEVKAWVEAQKAG